MGRIHSLLHRGADPYPPHMPLSDWLPGRFARLSTSNHQQGTLFSLMQVGWQGCHTCTPDRAAASQRPQPHTHRCAASTQRLMPPGHGPATSDLPHTSRLTPLQGCS